jgi:hypothetical protein
VLARTALLLAIVSGGLAVALVTLDLTFTLVVRIDAWEDGAWTTHAAAPSDDRYKPFGSDGCAPNQLRLVVDNHRPVGASRQASIYFMDDAQTRKDLLGTTLSLGAFEVYENPFQLPEEAFDISPSTPKRNVYVTANVGDLGLTKCVVREA